jgi:tryptophanyl-tRNA synthetase
MMTDPEAKNEVQPEKRKRILSGIQPTGTPTLGNYVGALRNFALLQKDYESIYMVADLHSLTVREVPADLRRHTRELAALMIATGIDPVSSILFVQSHVPAHCQLSWILACNTQFGELSRMTQFKDKSAKHPDNVNGGLFTYPVLMAADILVYNADLVPIGQDQTQHLEIARTIAQRFNSVYGDTFTLPAGYLPKAGAKIMSLAEPTKKMSKSDTNINSFILMTDDKDTILRKFKRAVTDSDGVVRFDKECKPGVSNLMTIYSVFTGKTADEITAEFADKGYGDFKAAVAEVTADALAPVQSEYNRILADKTYVDGVLADGAARAARLADRTVAKVYRKVGLMQIK